MGSSNDHNRRVVEAKGVPQPPGWSAGIVAGDWVFVSQMMASDYVGGLVSAAEIDRRNPFAADGMELQAKQIFSDIAQLLSDAGCEMTRDIIRMWQWSPSNYPSDADFRTGRLLWPRFSVPVEGYARQLRDKVIDTCRSSTGLGVRQLPIPDCSMAVDLMAVRHRPGLEKVSVKGPPGTPHSDLPFSPATRWGDWVFLAGFGATDFKGDWMGERHMGEPSSVAPEARVNPYFRLGSEIEAQTEYVLSVLKKVADAAGTSFERCVKADVYITHPSDFIGMDRVWRKWFPDNPPARSVITGTQLVMKGLRVEIAMQLLTNESPLQKVIIEADSVPAPPGGGPQAVRAGDLLFLGTLLPTDEAGALLWGLGRNEAAPFFSDPAHLQARCLFERVSAICTAGGTSLAEVCKVQAFFDDLAHLPAMLQAWRQAFPVAPPALTALGMGGGEPLLTPGAHLQLDVIAHVPT
jgi:enamine deaminase RidA (YjgF/YER057c/UK114 family)